MFEPMAKQLVYQEKLLGYQRKKGIDWDIVMGNMKKLASRAHRDLEYIAQGLAMSKIFVMLEADRACYSGV